MNGPELAAAAEALLTTSVPSRTIYVGAVPDGTIAARYLLVVTSEGDERATRTVDLENVQSPYLWVTSVSRNNSPKRAADEANWGAAEVRKALRGWRPDGSWRIRSYASVPAARNEAISATTFFAVEQFQAHSYI